MSALILSHDIGTTGDKATLFRDDGTLVAASFAAYPTSYPKPGWAEQDPRDYWTAFCRSTRELLEASGRAAADIAAVAFSGQMMAALAVDKEGTPLRPSIIWADVRATRETEELGRRVPASRVYRITGHKLSPSYAVEKILWIRANEPDVYRRTAKFIQAKDFLAVCLTGRMCSDYSDASGWNLFDITSLRWSDEILAASGISRSLLPELFESIDVVGKVTAGAAAASGLAQGTPVVIGASDGACATCGSGVVKEGDAYLCLGTSTWMATASGRPFFDPQERTSTFLHYVRGLYQPCGSMQAGGGSLKWFRDTLGDSEHAAANQSSVDAYQLLTEKACATPPGAEGLLFLPYLMGERSPWWNPAARGCFVGLSMRHGKGHLVRAVLEGVAYNMRIIADSFAGQGMRPGVMRIIGGAAKSGPWRQIFADVLEMPVAMLNFRDEATSIGAAIAGGVGVGIFPNIEEAARIVKVTETTNPDPSHYAVYRRLYPVFQKTYEQLRPVFDSLTE